MALGVMIAGVSGPGERDGGQVTRGPADGRRPGPGPPPAGRVILPNGPAARSASALAQRGGLLLDVIRPAVGQGRAPAGERDGPGYASPGPGLAEREHPRRRASQGEGIDTAACLVLLRRRPARRHGERDGVLELDARSADGGQGRRAVPMRAPG